MMLKWSSVHRFHHPATARGDKCTRNVVSCLVMLGLRRMLIPSIVLVILVTILFIGGKIQDRIVTDRCREQACDAFALNHRKDAASQAAEEENEWWSRIVENGAGAEKSTTRSSSRLAMEQLPECTTLNVTRSESLVLGAMDPALIDHIKAFVIKKTTPEAASSKVEPHLIERNSSTGELIDAFRWEMMKKLVIPKFFAKMNRTGTFFEAGALNTYNWSATHYLEKQHGWTGLLMEMSPLLDPYENALRYNRTNVNTAGACISPREWPCKGHYKAVISRSEIEHPGKSALGHILGSMDREQSRVGFGGGRKTGKSAVHRPTGGTLTQVIDKATGSPTGSYVYESPVICYPLISMLMAANLTQLDFLSLDIEGVEWEVLTTLPWDMVDIDVIRMDFDYYGLNDVNLIELLQSKGYQHRSEYLNHPQIPENDFGAVADRYVFSKIRPTPVDS